MTQSLLTKTQWVFLMDDARIQCETVTHKNVSDKQTHQFELDKGMHIMIINECTSLQAYNQMLSHYGACCWSHMYDINAYRDAYSVQDMKKQGILKEL